MARRNPAQHGQWDGIDNNNREARTITARALRHGSNTIFNTNRRQVFCDWRFSLWTSASQARKIQGLNTTWYTGMGFGRLGVGYSGRRETRDFARRTGESLPCFVGRVKREVRRERALTPNARNPSSARDQPHTPFKNAEMSRTSSAHTECGMGYVCQRTS
ncbi:hypothetical protein G6F32_015690 [Rhizopus arrhizus]|nr:hypothetical protein G6F32_015690 [Rhizopus arrhizus]